MTLLAESAEDMAMMDANALGMMVKESTDEANRALLQAKLDALSKHYYN